MLRPAERSRPSRPAAAARLQGRAQRPLGVALVCAGDPEDGDQAAADQAVQLTAMPRNDVAGLLRKVAQRGGDALRRGGLACLLPGADIGEEDGDDSVCLL